MRFLGAVVAIAAFAASSGGAFAQTRQALTDDVTRSELARYGDSLLPGTQALPRHFRLFEDVGARVVGIDVSHHQGELNWTALSNANLSFVFVKASEGGSYYDARFARNWSALATLRANGSRVRRGAYHFLSAGVPASRQVANFMETVGQFAADDLPPVVDVEWDFSRANGQYVLDARGRKIDRWDAVNRATTRERVLYWLTHVEAATGRVPIIYTHAQWWPSHIGNDPRFARYQIWIADMASESLNREAPVTPTGLGWSYWQISDRGRFTTGAPDVNFDVNVFNGTPAQFTALTSH